MKLRHLLSFGAATALVTTTSFAVAPPTQYAPFTKDSREIVDVKTHLAWYRGSTNAVDTVVAADVACGTVAPPGTYRLASLKEALTIVDAQPHLTYLADTKQNATLAVDAQAFGTLAPGEYWTTTKLSADKAYVVDLQTGLAHVEGGPGKRRGLCVRDAP